MSMYTFEQALYAFWSRFTWQGQAVPAYLSGQVPKGAQFPYITYTAKWGAYFSGAYLTATVWCKGGEDGASTNEQCAQLLSAIARAIPENGATLAVCGGCMKLWRNPSDFQTLMNDAEDESIIGGRTSYTVNFYDI